MSSMSARRCARRASSDLISWAWVANSASGATSFAAFSTASSALEVGIGLLLLHRFIVRMGRQRATDHAAGFLALSGPPGARMLVRRCRLRLFFAVFRLLPLVPGLPEQTLQRGQLRLHRVNRLGDRL